MTTNDGIGHPSALAEQLDMAYRDVSRFDDNAELGDGHQRKIDHYLNEYRARHAVIPIEHQGVLGGPDGTYTMGNLNARNISYRGSKHLPRYNPDDPNQTQIPFLILAWNLDDEWAVRAPCSIEKIISGFVFGPDQPCDWHLGPAKPGTHRPGVMVRTQGQLILLLHVCGSCRDRLSESYRGGLLFFELDSMRRITVPHRS